MATETTLPLLLSPGSAAIQSRQHCFNI